MAIGGEIPAAPGAGLEQLLAGSGDLLTDLGAIAKSLKNILGRTEKGEGFLGAITSNSEESEKLGSNFNATLRSLNSILAKVDRGKGLAGRLLIDEKYGKETSESLAGAIRSVQSLLAQIDEGVRTGNGAIPALLSDPEGKKKIYALVDNLSVTAAGLVKITENLQSGSGAIPILLHDAQFGKAFTGNLRSLSEHLDSISRKLDEGQGTAGKLINDPSVFDAANHLVVGVNESAILRWLIKDRQKAGIKKEYQRRGPRPGRRRGADARAPAVKLLITGGAGFIGSHLADRRLAKGDRVVVLDDFNDFYDPRVKRGNVAAHLRHPQYRLVEGDIRDRALVFRLFAEEQFDGVLHFAARAGVRPSLTQPVLYEEVNCVATLAPARGGRRPRQAAFRLRFVVVGLRDQCEAALLRGGSHRPADLPVRNDQARGRAPGLQLRTTCTA